MVDHTRGQLEVRAEDAALHIARREHAKIVQAELADCHDFWISCHLAVVHSYLVAVGRGIMWVCAGSSKYDTRVLLCQRERELTRGEVAARINDTGDAAFEGGRDYGFAVGIETGGVNVGVAIDEQPGFLSDRQKREARVSSGFFFSSLHLV